MARAGSVDGNELLAWFRPSIRRRVVLAWVQAVSLVLSGAIVLAALRVEGVDFGSPLLPIYLVGLLLVMSGPLWLATRLSKLLARERCLALDEQGLSWIVGEAVADRFLWTEIDRVELEEQTIVIAGEGRRLELPDRFEDLPPETLVTTLKEARRRAMMGISVRAGLRAATSDRA